jgi:hypothetical protein
VWDEGSALRLGSGLLIKVFDGVVIIPCCFEIHYDVGFMGFRIDESTTSAPHTPS